MNEKLLQGDCLKLMPKLPDKSIDLVVTDPPYDVYAGKGGGAFGRAHIFMQNSNKSSDNAEKNVVQSVSEKTVDEPAKETEETVETPKKRKRHWWQLGR